MVGLLTFKNIFLHNYILYHWKYFQVEKAHNIITLYLFNGKYKKKHSNSIELLSRRVIRDVGLLCGCVLAERTSGI